MARRSDYDASEAAATSSDLISKKLCDAGMSLDGIHEQHWTRPEQAANLMPAAGMYHGRSTFDRNLDAIFKAVIQAQSGRSFKRLTPGSAATSQRNGKAPVKSPINRRWAPYHSGKSQLPDNTTGDLKIRRSAKSAGKKKEQSGPLLACPFYKRNPIRHLRCLLRNVLTETSFVVQHLERGHPVQPIHCPVCGLTFEHERVQQQHVRERTCERRDFHFEGLTTDQKAAIRRNRRGLDVSQRWYELWDILYPGEPRPNSIYVADPFTEFHGILRRLFRYAVTHNSGPWADVSDYLQRTGGRIDDTRWETIRPLIPDLDDLSFLASDVLVPNLAAPQNGGQAVVSLTSEVPPPPPPPPLLPSGPSLPDSATGYAAGDSNGHGGTLAMPGFNGDGFYWPAFYDGNPHIDPLVFLQASSLGTGVVAGSDNFDNTTWPTWGGLSPTISSDQIYSALVSSDVGQTNTTEPTSGQADDTLPSGAGPSRYRPSPGDGGLPDERGSPPPPP